MQKPSEVAIGGSTTQVCQRLMIGLFALVLVLGGWSSAWAQALNWEGQTGVFVTPLAYVVPSNTNGLGIPVVAYHYLSGGSVLGGFNQVSITEGAWRRLEFGYTRDIHSSGSDAALSGLWSSGFNVFHAKLNFLPENVARHTWVPAVAIGFVARTQVQNVGGALAGRDTNNADFYVVATKTVTSIRSLPLVFNFGYKSTNASLLGLAGNAPGFEGRAFGAAAFALRGPYRSTLLLGSEVLQEPRHLEGLPLATIPTTLTYAIRIVPSGMAPSVHDGWKGDTPKLSVDLGIAQAAGRIMQGVNLAARQQFALGVSYGF